MNYEEKTNAYLNMLQEAIKMEDLAGIASHTGKYDQAAEKYYKASVLYARAADSLLDLMDAADSSERTEYQLCINRLISISSQMKKRAEIAARFRNQHGKTYKRKQHTNRPGQCQGKPGSYHSGSQIPDMGLT